MLEFLREKIMNKKKTKFYFIGLGGLGMSSVAGLLKEADFEVTGSDVGMSDAVKNLLSEMEIPVKKGYLEKNILEDDSDIYVIGNSLSRGNPELEAVLSLNRSYSSFPKVLEDFFLNEKTSIVVCGTHGKSTTSSWITHCLEKLGTQPSSMIGAIPAGKTRNSSYGKGELFVLEGDEYDTAFFDKGSKFLHYKPKFVIMNNIEYDHADIFKDLEAIYKTFEKLLTLVSEPKRIIANIDDKGVFTLLQRMNLLDKVYKVSTKGMRNDIADLSLLESKTYPDGGSSLLFSEKTLGKHQVKIKLSGDYNLSNALQTIGLMTLLQRENLLNGANLSSQLDALSSFLGVQKRLENLGSYQKAVIYRDFGHHPTAIESTLKNLRAIYPEARIVAGFEPKNATSRRNIFSERYKEVFKKADLAFFTLPPEDKRLEAKEKMDIYDIQDSLTKEKASVLETKGDLQKWCQTTLKKGDVCVFFSCSEFMNLPAELVS